MIFIHVSFILFFLLQNPSIVLFVRYLLLTQLKLFPFLHFPPVFLCIHIQIKWKERGLTQSLSCQTANFLFSAKSNSWKIKERRTFYRSLWKSFVTSLTWWPLAIVLVLLAAERCAAYYGMCTYIFYKLWKYWFFISACRLSLQCSQLNFKRKKCVYRFLQNVPACWIHLNI